MVLPPSTAAEGEAPSAGWLRELRRWLHLGHKGVIVAIRNAHPARLRELVETMEEIEPGFTFTTRAEDVAECAPGSLVLLALREEDLEWLNLNRPLFAQRALRAVLWTEAPLAGSLKFRAPDLHDWVSHFVSCPKGVPPFALEGLRVGLRWWPGVAWRGEELELALAQMGMDETIALNPADDFAVLEEALSSSPAPRSVRWVGVDTARKLWRIRWALASARHTGANILDNPKIAAPGWYEVDTQQIDLHRAVRQLLQAGAVNPAKLAAQLGLEPGMIGGGSQRSTPGVGEGADDTVGRAALLQAEPHVQRRLQDHPAVLGARRSLATQMRRIPPSRPWSRTELGVFASIERDRVVWPNWTELRLIKWMFEHSLRMATRPEERGLVAALMGFFGESDILRVLEERGWTPPADPDEIMRDFSVELAGGREGILELGNDFGWDTPVMVRALAGTILTMVEDDETTAIVDVLDDVLEAASTQLGHDDPDYGSIGRIAGIGMSLAGLHDRASDLMHHALRVLPKHSDFRRLAAIELPVIMVLRGRFMEAVEMFGRSTDLDRLATRISIGARLSAGTPVPRPPSGPVLLDQSARQYLELKLRELTGARRR